MSITSARQSFVNGLDGKATCTGARMNYDNATKEQLFAFDVVVNGVASTVIVAVPSAGNIDTLVAAGGRDFAATLET